MLFSLPRSLPAPPRMFHKASFSPFPTSRLPVTMPRIAPENGRARGAAVTVGIFETVTAAAEKTIELENYPVTGIFFNILIETGVGAGSEQQAFGHLEHTGKRTNRCYLVKRVQH
jgi:hypothetical protein